MTLEDLLTPLDRVFRDERIGYAVIGAYAVAAWGEIRATRDPDLLTEIADLPRLASGLRAAQIPCDRKTGDAEDPIGAVLQASGYTIWRVDFLPHRRRPS